MKYTLHLALTLLASTILAGSAFGSDVIPIKVPGYEDLKWGTPLDEARIKYPDLACFVPDEHGIAECSRRSLKSVETPQFFLAFEKGRLGKISALFAGDDEKAVKKEFSRLLSQTSAALGKPTSKPGEYRSTQYSWKKGTSLAKASKYSSYFKFEISDQANSEAIAKNKIESVTLFGITLGETGYEDFIKEAQSNGWKIVETNFKLLPFESNVGIGVTNFSLEGVVQADFFFEKGVLFQINYWFVDKNTSGRKSKSSVTFFRNLLSEKYGKPISVSDYSSKWSVNSGTNKEVEIEMFALTDKEKVTSISYIFEPIYIPLARQWREKQNNINKLKEESLKLGL